MITRRKWLELLGQASIGAALAACTGDTETAVVSPATEPPLLSDLHYRSLAEVARMIEAGEISPVALTEMMLARIEALDDRLKSYATVTAERALSAARRAEQEITAGNYRGPMHGIPIAVKDLCYTRGTRTMGGMAVYRDFVPDHDATVVARLENAGAVLLGKLNLTEGAMAGYHRDFDIPVNPWNEELWTGASSSGSGVAVAAGLCYAALGSDTGGSIRFPSMANAIVGLKPTYGRVSRHGVLPLAETLDHVGPMTRRTADAAIMLQAMAGHDENDPTSLRAAMPDLLAGLDDGVRGMKIGYDREFSSEGIDPGLVASVERALATLEGLGAEIVEVNMPPGSRETGEAWFALCSYEAHQAHAAHYPARAAEYGNYFRDFLAFGASVTEQQYAAASEYRQAFNAQFDQVLAGVDTMVCPAGGITFPLDQQTQYLGSAELDPVFVTVQMYFTIPADFAGTPALTLPCGFSDSGVPHSFQFLGPRQSEPLLLRCGQAYESATRWHQHHPPV